VYDDSDGSVRFATDSRNTIVVSRQKPKASEYKNDETGQGRRIHILRTVARRIVRPHDHTSDAPEVMVDPFPSVVAY